MKQFLFNLKKTWKLIFLYPQKTISASYGDHDAYWEDKRKNNLGSLSKWQKQRADIALSYIDKEGGVSITDIGCGDGAILSYIHSKIPEAKLTGIDESQVALEKVREAGITAITANVADADIADVVPESDYLFLFEVLEHIPNPEHALKVLSKKAKKGICFSFPNTGYIAHRLRLLFGKFPLQWNVHPGEHVRFWTYGDVKWWLTALGYSKYRIHVYEGVPILRTIFPGLFGMGIFVYIES